MALVASWVLSSKVWTASYASMKVESYCDVLSAKAPLELGLLIGEGSCPCRRLPGMLGTLRGGKSMKGFLGVGVGHEPGEAKPAPAVAVWSP